MSVPLAVDVTGWLIDRLTTALSGVGVDTETPDDLADAIPFVRVERVGGVDDNFILDNPRMVYDCWAANLRAANELAYTVRVALDQMRGLSTAGATLTLSRKNGGPSAAVSGNPNLKHVVLTMNHWIKATP